MHLRSRSLASEREITASCRPIKNLPLGDGRGSEIIRNLSADDVCRLEAFGAFQQIKLHGLTFIERAVTILLDGGEVHEYIFSRGALDESISLRPVKPLDCTFLSHGKYSFHNREEYSPAVSIVAPVVWKPPSKMPVELAVASTRAKEILQKRKRLLSPHRGMFPPCEHSEPDNLARFHHTANVNHYHNLIGLTTGPIPRLSHR